jgi:hypothetical protein
MTPQGRGEALLLEAVLEQRGEAAEQRGEAAEQRGEAALEQRGEAAEQRGVAARLAAAEAQLRALKGMQEKLEADLGQIRGMVVAGRAPPATG